MSREIPPLQLTRVVLDVVDVDRAIAFWSRALGYEVTHRDEEFVLLRDPARPHVTALGLQPTREPKSGVNAVHLEVFTDDMEREASRLEGLGGSRAVPWDYPPGERNWIVMRDPDGHEFCVVEMPRGVLARTA